MVQESEMVSGIQIRVCWEGSDTSAEQTRVCVRLQKAGRAVVFSVWPLCLKGFHSPYQHSPYKEKTLQGLLLQGTASPLPRSWQLYLLSLPVESSAARNGFLALPASSRAPHFQTTTGLCHHSLKPACPIPHSHALCGFGDSDVTITDHYLSSRLSLSSTQ